MAERRRVQQRHRATQHVIGRPGDAPGARGAAGGANVSARDEYRSALLHLAVFDHDLEDLRGLIDAGANLDARPDNGRRPDRA